LDERIHPSLRIGNMRVRFIIIAALLTVLASGCARLSSTRAESQDLLLSFPNRVKPGEQVVRFELRVQNGEILTVNKVPFDWIINVCVEAPMSEMSGFPNHGASAFQDMTPLRRFLTVRKDRTPFGVTGCFVVTRDFAKEWTNCLTETDFILERIAPNKSVHSKAATAGR
jgi:hypothetical protein